MRITHARKIYLPVLLAFIGCGETKENAPADKSAVKNSMAYADWCQDWKVACPQAGNNVSFNEKDWHALTSLVSAFLSGSNNFEVTRADLSNNSFKTAMTQLGYSQMANTVLQKLGNISFKSIAVKNGDGAIHITFDNAVTVKSNSGVQFTFAPSVDLSLREDKAISVSGVTMSSADGKQSHPLRAIKMTGANQMDWEIGTMKVAKAPADFFRAEFSQNVPQGNLDVAAQSVIRAIGPIKDWLAVGSRELSFGQGFFSSLRTTGASFANTPTSQAFLNNIQTFRVGFASAKIAEVGMSKKIKCDNGSARIFITSPSLTQVDTSQSGIVRLGISGIRAGLSQNEAESQAITSADVTPTGFKTTVKLGVLSIPITIPFGGASSSPMNCTAI